jgi:hypothetical protein
MFSLVERDMLTRVWDEMDYLIENDISLGIKMLKI